MGCPEQVNEFILREAPARADFNPFSEWLTDEGWAIIQVTSLSLLSLLLSSLELSDTTIYEPEIRAFLGAASHFCEEAYGPNRVTA